MGEVYNLRLHTDYLRRRVEQRLGATGAEAIPAPGPSPAPAPADAPLRPAA